jgi:hypothetical protein
MPTRTARTAWNGREIAEASTAGCPVSRALAGTTITLDAGLE